MNSRSASIAAGHLGVDFAVKLPYTSSRLYSTADNSSKHNTAKCSEEEDRPWTLESLCNIGGDSITNGEGKDSTSERRCCWTWPRCWFGPDINWWLLRGRRKNWNLWNSQWKMSFETCMNFFVQNLKWRCNKWFLKISFDNFLHPRVWSWVELKFWFDFFQLSKCKPIS